MKVFYMHVDAEVHFWKYSKTLTNPLIRSNKLLQQHYLPEQLSQNMQRNGINTCIAVVDEAAELETRFLSELAMTHPEISGIVGWIDLYAADATDKLHEFHLYSPLKGFSINAGKNQEPDAGVMELFGEYQYSLDITLNADTDVNALSNWVQAYPNQQFILRNAGNPDAKQSPSTEWETMIRALAKNPNLSCKVSGLLTSANWKSWKPAGFYPFLDILFSSFGTERLMFASDWPFVLLAGIYVQWKSLLEKFTGHFIEEDKNKFFGENARRIYRL